jgi:bifunctional UDP-N-acetylglucosamine pyrophosphorylase/glucosamine-1-phosphate N-acetyltransferase
MHHEMNNCGVPMSKPLAVVILAAGKGTRMKSALPKMMHAIAGVPMIGHVLRAVEPLNPERTIVVVGPDVPALVEYVKSHVTVTQHEQKGTGHAAATARDALAGFEGDVLLMFGDTPLFKADSIRRLVEARTADGADHAVVMLGMRPADPRAYGRLIVGPGGLERIVEAKDATPEELKVDLVWSGVLVADGKHLFRLLDMLDNDNAQGEYYLPYIVQKARELGLSCAVTEVDEAEAAGVNSRGELALAEAVMQERLRADAMAGGATLIDPSTVYFSMDTQLGRDVVVEPNVIFGPGVTIGDNVTIKAFCHIEGATIGSGAIIGPFARLRPRSEVGENTHIGNFVELKNTKTGNGTRANHFSYLGDTDIGGNRTNIGAGTIICNYDGYDKFRSTIGENVMIGSNSTIVSPVTIGDGSFVAAGSVITQDVEPDSMAFGRAQQVNKPGRGAAFRAAKLKLKEGS